MRILATILVATVCGVGVGYGTAVLKIRQHPSEGVSEKQPSAGGSQVAVDQEEFDFGKMDSSENGKHEFIFTNRGDHSLTLNPGSTSCSCTVSEIKDNDLAPGQSTKVLVSWRSKGRIGPFQQSLTIVTSDPLRPEVTLTIQGEYTRSVYADPDELAYGQISGTEPIVREACILCNLPRQQIKIQGHQMSNPGLEKFFQVDDVPLGADELRKYKGVTNGVLVRVTVKPGLPLGSFQQTICLSTNLPAVSEIDLPLFGSVGEVSLIGSGWRSDTGVLDIGVVEGHGVTQRKLIVLVRGSNAKEMKFKVASIEPDFLDVKLGKTTVADTSCTLSQTELLIEIPTIEILKRKRKSSANFMGAENGKLGEILLEAIPPRVYSLRIRVRFAVVDGS